jgi:GNAT superfamily N-acetyltransferase
MANTLPIPGIVVRKAEPSDADSLLYLIDKLAEYEQLPPPDAAAKERLVRDTSGDSPRLEAWLAWAGSEPIGYALVFETYSSFLALPTMYLEDVFVLEEYRNRKAGLALFLTVADLARERGCGRIDFAVLDWNTTAQKFYNDLGALHLPEWQLFRMTSDDFGTLPKPLFNHE